MSEKEIAQTEKFTPPSRLVTLRLPEGDGTPQVLLKMDIPLADGRWASISYPWPMTEQQYEAFVFQLDHQLELLKRFFVVPTAVQNCPDEVNPE